MKRYALVIGISVYESPNLPHLAKPALSAEALARVLEEHGNFQDVRRLPAYWLSSDRCEVATQAKLSATELSAALKQFLEEQLKDGGEALIYFSGHGFVMPDDLGGSEAFLAASDTELGVKNGQVSWYRNAISLRSLSQQFTKSNLNSLVVLLDCCHSGMLIESNAVQQVLTTAGDRTYALMAACRDFEKAYEGGETSPHSIFSTALLKGLARDQVGASGGSISSQDLGAVIDRELKGKGQEPVWLMYKQPMAIVTYPPVVASPTPAPPNEFNRTNPYLGLYAFNEADTDRFFGREQAIWDVISCIASNRFLAVMGASGSGKSSLVKAGVLPRLKQGGSNQWQIAPVITPGRHPRRRLMELIEQQPPADLPLLLVIDQFEEVFTLCEDESERRGFLRLIANLASSGDRPTHIVTVIRADFMVKCGDYAEIADLINVSRPTGYMVKSLCLPDFQPELEAAIANPARQQGVQFEPGLVHQIITDVMDRPGALPLLQYALKELWKVCIEEPASPTPTLTWAGYDTIGRVGGALENLANLLYSSFSLAEQKLVQCIFVQELVQPGEGETVTRRRTTWERLEAIAHPPDFSPEMLRDVVNQLANERLIATDEHTVEIAHESLLTEWTQLHDWIAADREKIRLRHRLEADCHDWQEKYQQADDALLMGASLAAIEEKLDWHNLPEAEYVRKSLARREEKRRQEIRFYRRTAIGAIVASLCITGVAVLAGVQWRTADKEQIQARITSAKALFKSNRNSLDALAEGLHAGKQLQQSTWFRNDPQLRSSVLEVVGQAVYWVREHNRLEGHLNEVVSVSFSPDGQMLATASYDSTAKLWAPDGKELHTLTGHQLSVEDITFSPDGQTIATASKDKTIKLWTKNGKLLRTLTGHTDTVWNTRFSPDGRFLLSASSDSTAKLWNWQRGKVIANLPGHRGRVSDVAFSPDGRTIATAGSDTTIRLWTLKGKPVRILQGHGKPAYSVNFSPDGQAIVSASEDNTAIVWQRNSQRGSWSDSTSIQLIRLEGHEGIVRDAVFSPDGQTIATASEDKTIKLWQRNGTLIETLQGHQGQIYGINFNQDGTLLASASRDKTVKLWQTNNWLKILAGHRGTLQRVNFSPDGQTIGVAGDKSTARLWNANGKTFVDLKGHSGPVYDISFSPNGQFVATAGDDKTAKIWHLNGDLFANLTGHKTFVSGVSFSFDNQIVATSSADPNVKIWNWQNKSLIQTLSGDNTAIGSVSFSRDGTLATSDYAGNIKLWGSDRSLLKAWQGYKP